MIVDHSSPLHKRTQPPSIQAEPLPESYAGSPDHSISTESKSTDQIPEPLLITGIENSWQAVGGLAVSTLETESFVAQSINMHEKLISVSPALEFLIGNDELYSDISQDDVSVEVSTDHPSESLTDSSGLHIGQPLSLDDNHASRIDRGYTEFDAKAQTQYNASDNVDEMPVSCLPTENPIAILPRVETRQLTKIPDTSEKPLASSESIQNLSNSSSHSTADLVIDLSAASKSTSDASVAVHTPSEKHESEISNIHVTDDKVQEVSADFVQKDQQLMSHSSGSSSTLPDYSHIIAPVLDEKKLTTSQQTKQDAGQENGVSPHANFSSNNEKVQNVQCSSPSKLEDDVAVVKPDVMNDSGSFTPLRLDKQLKPIDSVSVVDSKAITASQTSSHSVIVTPDVTQVCLSESSSSILSPAPLLGRSSSIASALKSKLGKLKIRSTNSNCKFSVLRSSTRR